MLNKHLAEAKLRSQITARYNNLKQQQCIKTLLKLPMKTFLEIPSVYIKEMYKTDLDLFLFQEPVWTIVPNQS